MKPDVLFIVGPTASGKTALSVELAKHIDCEIISADSRQIYKYMDIGTAKPTRAELAAVPHYFIDIKNPDEYYSAGQFGVEARVVIADIVKRKKQPVVVGGSGLYIHGLIDGFFWPKIADQQVKTKLKQELKINGISSLYDKLKIVDPLTAKKLPATDTQRILRALEVFAITGVPFAKYLEKKSIPANFNPVMFGLFVDREVLYTRIEKRVDLMIKNGLTDEVQKLLDLGYHEELNALQTVGYKEVFMYFNKKIVKEQMVALIKQKTRNYAKRQLTWFRKDERIEWLNLSEDNLTSKIISSIIHKLSFPLK